MTLRSLSAALALVVIATGPALADQLADITARGTLRCGVLSVANPFGFQDPDTREIVGYDVDFCRAVAGEMGLDAEIVPVAVEARIPELQLGNIDILAAALGYTAERAEQIDYSDRYFVSRQVVIVAGDSTVASLADLDGLRIATNSGSSNIDYLRNQVPGAEVLTYQDTAAAFLAFAQGRVDGVAISELATMQLRQQGAVDFRIVQEPLRIEPWGLGVRKGEASLVAAVNQAMESMEASGQVEAIFNAWFGPETPFHLTLGFAVGPITE